MLVYRILENNCQAECISQLDVVLLANKRQFLKNSVQLIVYLSRLLVQYLHLISVFVEADKM